MSHVRSLRVVRFFTIALLAILQCGTALGQEKKPAEPVPMPPMEVHNFQLRHAKAQEIAKLLEKIFADTRLHVVADERTNSLFLRGSAAKLGEIREFIKKVDTVDDPRRNISVFSLRSIEPDEALEAGLRVLFKGKDGNFALDRGRKLIIVSADEGTLQTVEAVLLKLDVVQTAKSPADVQMRIVWLVGGPEDADGADAKTFPLPVPSDDLKEVLPGLAKLGITEPRVAAQFLIRAKPNNQFLATGSGRIPQLAGPLSVTVSGALGDNGEPPEMRMVIEVSRERGVNAKGFKAQKPTEAEAAPAVTPLQVEVLTHLETNISAPPGHLVVLGVTPMRGTIRSMTSAFVVQVLGDKNRKETTRKK